MSRSILNNVSVERPGYLGGRWRLFRRGAGLLGVAVGLLFAVAGVQAARPEPTNWFAGDMHVHRSCGASPVSVSSIYNAMVAQDLSVVSLLADMGNGEVQNAATDLPKVTGADDAVSTNGRIVHWDAEWHWDATYTQYPYQALGGHIVALGLTNAQQLWSEYTYPIIDWAQQQGGIAGFAHFQYLPASGFPQTLDCCLPIEYPVEVALGACDFISQDVAGSDSAMLAYYRLLNCGLRPGLAGGSDYPCNANIGAVMTFVKVDGPLTYRKWIEGIRDGHTVVSRNGRQEFLNLSVNTNAIPGDEINLPAGGGTVQVSLKWSAISNLTGTIELVQNGVVITNMAASVGLNNPASLAATVTFTNSGWLAARRMGNGQHQVHTAAIFVTVNNQPVRTSVADAQFYVNWMDELLQRTGPGGVWNYFFPNNLAQVQARYQAARAVYQQIATEAAALVPPRIGTTNLSAGYLNSPYSAGLTAIGGLTPYTWSVSAGQLPPGLTLNSNTGVIAGTPTSAGTFNFSIQVADASALPQTDARALSITITNFVSSLGILGYTNNGTSPDPIYGGMPYINASRFLASSNTTLAFIRARVVGISGSYKCAIYTESNGLPVRLLRSTATVTAPGTGWQTFPLTSPLTVTNGSYYWLAIWSDDPAAQVYFTTGLGSLRWSSASYGAWPDPLTTVDGSTATHSIYATGGSAPAFTTVPADRTLAESTSLVVTNGATDADAGYQTLLYTLASAPTNAAISAAGVITWTPTEAQGPGTNVLVTVVSDGLVGVTNAFSVVVTEANVPPTFALTPTNLTLRPPALLSVTNHAVDDDLPANVLTYHLVDAPTNASISSEGLITWEPAAGQAPSTNVFTTVVGDGNSSVTNEFLVYVLAPLAPPVFIAISVTNDVVSLTWSAEPGQSYVLEYADGFGGTNWAALPGVVATNSTVTVTNLTDGAPQRLFRVRSPQ